LIKAFNAQVIGQTKAGRKLRNRQEYLLDLRTGTSCGGNVKSAVLVDTRNEQAFAPVHDVAAEFD